MSATSPITQRDIAQACGLHPSTVCLALKNSPSIPEETRRRVHALAAELGYSPNVAARNLALLRGEKRATVALPLAWVNQEQRRDHWRCDPEAQVLFAGARRRAAEAGYYLEEIWAREPGMTGTRIVQILRTRGVEGVLFPVHQSFDFALLNRTWGDFSLVGLNDHRLGEWVDVVMPDHYRNMDRALRRLRETGFSRPGLVLTPQCDAATGGMLRSCFLKHQADAPETDRVPVSFVASTDRLGRVTLTEWYEEHAPDVVLCPCAPVLELAESVVSDAWLVPFRSGLEAGTAGVEIGAAELGAAAIDCLVEKLRRFERGVRESTRLHAIKGTWQDGPIAAARFTSVVA